MNSGYQRVVEVAGYHLAEKIGSGGMGEVYKAYNSSLNRYAAVKILHQAAFTERFKNEANIQSFINHPNIVHLYEYVVQGDQHCIVMEYVEGESLDSILRKKGKLSNEETENILRQVISALAYLHRKNIMHRDIKPQNFKIQSDGTVKMLDFGIAKHQNSPKLTQLGFVIGTMEYLAPEQFQQKEDLKADIWCFAVMTYELLTGYMPFESSNPVTLQAKITKGIFVNPKILVPEISDKLAGIIEKSLKVNPANRITAVGIENLLAINNRQEKVIVNSRQLPASLKKMLLPGAAFLAVLLLLIFLFRNNKPDAKPQVQENPVIGTEKEKEVLINVPGINDAELIFNDSTRLPLPYLVKGKEGDQFEFIIHADGYKDKKVQVEITPRRSSFEFNLEKINN